MNPHGLANSAPTPVGLLDWPLCAHHPLMSAGLSPAMLVLLWPEIRIPLHELCGSMPSIGVSSD